MTQHASRHLKNIEKYLYNTAPANRDAGVAARSPSKPLGKPSRLEYDAGSPSTPEPLGRPQNGEWSVLQRGILKSH